MIFKKETMAWDGTSATNEIRSFYNYLSHYDNRFTLDTTNNTLGFNNVFKIRLTTTNYGRPQLYLVCSDAGETEYGPVSTSGSWNNTSSKTATLIITNNMIYFRCDLDASYGVGFVWLLDNNNKNFAAVAGNTRSIGGFNFYDVADGGATVYNIGKFMNFAMPAGEVYYTDNCVLIATTSGAKGIIPVLLSSSTLTVEQTITISGKNYYTIGTNTLLPLDAA